MSQIQSQQTTYLVDRRPFIVRASVTLDDGRLVQAVGHSLLRRKSAIDKALDRAHQLAEETNLGTEITYVRAFLADATILDDVVKTRGGLLRNTPVALYAYQVQLIASTSETATEVTGTSFFSLQRALTDAVQTAQDRLKRM